MAPLWSSGTSHHRDHRSSSFPLKSVRRLLRPPPLRQSLRPAQPFLRPSLEPSPALLPAPSLAPSWGLSAARSAGQLAVALEAAPEGLEVPRCRS